MYSIVFLTIKPNKNNRSTLLLSYLISVLRSRGMYTICVHIIMLDMLLAVVQLQQLLLLLLLKLHAHKSCSGAATAVAVVRHRVPDVAICCCVFFAPDSSFFFFVIQTRIFVNVPLGSAVACTASTCLYSYTHSILYLMHP